MNSLQLKIVKTSGVESFSIDGDTRNLFSEVWNSVAFTIGIKKPLIEQELKIIYDFLTEHFRSLSLEDVREAFSLYSAQKLDHKNSHYQSLDNSFIGCVLSSYKRYKSLEYVINQNKLETKEPLQLVYSTKIGEDSYKFIGQVFKDTGEEPMIANWKHAFYFMWDKEMFDVREYQQFIYSVKNEITNEVKTLRKYRKIAAASSMIKILGSKELLVLEVKKRFIIKHFKK